MQKHGRSKELETIVNVAAAIYYLGDWATETAIVNYMIENHGLSRTSTQRALKDLRESGAITSKGYSVGKQHRAIKEVALEHVLFTMSSNLIERDMAIFGKMQIPGEIWDHYLNGARERAKEDAEYFIEAIRMARDSGSEFALFFTSYNAARFVGDYVKNWKKEKTLDRAAPSTVEILTKNPVDEYLNKLEHA